MSQNVYRGGDLLHTVAHGLTVVYYTYKIVIDSMTIIIIPKLICIHRGMIEEKYFFVLKTDQCN